MLNMILILHLRYDLRKEISMEIWLVDREGVEIRRFPYKLLGGEPVDLQKINWKMLNWLDI